MPAARQAWAREVHRRKIAALLAWSLIVLIIMCFAIGLVLVWSNIVASLFSLLSASVAIIALSLLYNLERRHYGKQNVC